jgi:hypothetical protein
MHCHQDPFAALEVLAWYGKPGHVKEVQAWWRALEAGNTSQQCVTSAREGAMLEVKLGATDADKLRSSALLLVCDHCGRQFQTLEEAFLTYMQPTRVGRRAPCGWAHRMCAERSNPGCRLWRSDLALQSLWRAMSHAAYLHLAKENMPRMIHPSYEG